MGMQGNTPEIQNLKIVPVILAGGMGKRLRPLTGEKSPKPFLRVFSKYSLFQNTVLRVSNFQKPIIVCHHSYLDHVVEHLSEINVTPRAIILEPYHKGTAAAIAMAAFYLKNKGEYMLVLPSDHVLGTEGTIKTANSDDISQDAQSRPAQKKYFEYLTRRAAENSGDKIVIIGAKPSRVETGYGYILHQDLTADNCAKVTKFLEKPEQEEVVKILKQGGCLWNTGIFVSKPRVFLKELKAAQSDIYEFAQRAFYAGEEIKNTYIPSAHDFVKIPTMSIDYAMMERSKNMYVAKMTLPWSDVGTWPQILRLKIDKMLKKPMLRPISKMFFHRKYR